MPHFESKVAGSKVVVFVDKSTDLSVHIVQTFLCSENKVISQITTISLTEDLVNFMTAYYVMDVEYPFETDTLLFLGLFDG